MGWLSKNFDRQAVVIFQAREHTCSMSSVWKTTTVQNIGTFYDAIKLCSFKIVNHNKIIICPGAVTADTTRRFTRFSSLSFR